MPTPRRPDSPKFAAVWLPFASVVNLLCIRDGSSHRPVTRRKREMIPPDKKDAAYRDKRLKNNELAERSRERRGMKDLILQGRLLDLSEENAQLRAQELRLRCLSVEKSNVASIETWCPTQSPALFQPRVWGDSRSSPDNLLLAGLSVVLDLIHILTAVAHGKVSCPSPGHESARLTHMHVMSPPAMPPQKQFTHLLTIHLPTVDSCQHLTHSVMPPSSHTQAQVGCYPIHQQPTSSCTTKFCYHGGLPTRLHPTARLSMCKGSTAKVSPWRKTFKRNARSASEAHRQRGGLSYPKMYLSPDRHEILSV